MSHIALQVVTDARTLVASLILALMWLSFETSLTLAQVPTAITPTTGVGSLGTTVTADSHTVQITGGTRPGNGTNLFHSFDQFNVGHPDTAQFLNTTPSLHTSNILGRVTGGNPSSIFGTIDTMSYPQANLFLMNPAGIVFGPNATLTVGGSVAFTTADYLRLAEANGSHAGIFHADTTATSLLTSASVAAFGFLGTNPLAISIQGIQESELRVQPGQSISLVGGNKGFTYTNQDMGTSASVPGGVSVTGRHLLAPGGQVNIASVASPGEITAGTLEYAPNVNGQSFGTFGTIQMSQQSAIDTSGEGGGTILIRGGRLIVDASTISSNTGDIILDATSIRITDAAQITTRTATEANAGHIILKASGNIDMDSAIDMSFPLVSLVGSLSEGAAGHAGNITFRSSQGNMSLTNAQVISGTSDGSGNAGNINIDTPHGDIHLADKSFIFNSAERGTGTLGNIHITAHDLHLRHLSAIGGDNLSIPIPGSTKVAGNIEITLDGHLTLAGGSLINTGTFGPAASADLIISAPDILITGKDTAGSSSLFTGTTSSGEGGQLRLFTDNLQLADGGTLSSKSSIGVTKETPSGSGGVISIQGLSGPSTSVTIDGPGSGIFTTAAGTGNGGAINLSAQSLTMTNGATITASSTNTGPNPGNAGDILINAGQSLEMRDSSITTQAKQASGGNINIQAVDHIRLVNSVVSSSVADGPGGGGNISIDPQVVALQDSKILAQAADGQGGAIKVITSLFLRDANSIVNADAGSSGLNGTVTIQSPTSNLSESLGTLPSNPSQAHSLLTQRCAALVNNGQASSFVVAGREQLPSDPGGWLSSPLALVSLGESLDADNAVASIPTVMAIAAQDTGTVSLRRLTPAGFLMANFANSEATGCRS